jgi:hypothetical protein
MNQRIGELRNNLIAGMQEYMKLGGADDESDPEYDPDFDAGYTQKHIDQCDQILNAFFADLGRVPQENREKAITDAVRTAVLAFNELNEQCDFGLIETDQREDLCSILLLGARDAGLATVDDITMEWREW